MTSITYYVVLPFVRDEDGMLCAEEGVEVPSAPAARGRAARLAVQKAGVIAFARSGDPALGEFQPAEILVRYGETPEQLD